MKNIYLDNAATTPLTDSVKEYLISILDDFGKTDYIKRKTGRCKIH